nr:SIR2 family protein [Streptococcus uberis]
MDGIDLETALQKSVVSNHIESEIINTTYNLISKEDEIIFKNILEKKKVLKFSEYLKQFQTNLYNLVVITTNYDLLIEYACEVINLNYSDSFYGKIISKFSPQDSEKEMLEAVVRGKNPKNIYKKYVKIFKPHGSINWKIIDGNILKIKNSEMGIPCIITPGSNKYEKGYRIPFDYHIGQMGQEIDKAKRIIFIGYGFNDNHLETHLNSTINIAKPKLIFTKSLTENAKKIIKNAPNTIALESNDEPEKNGTKIYINDEIVYINGKELWDISVLIKELFK